MAQAYQETRVELLTPALNAINDLSDWQWNCVTLVATGVEKTIGVGGTGVASAELGGCYVLLNKPTSGQPCEVGVAPNTVKARADGTAVIAGTACLAGNSGTVEGASSRGQSLVLGIALQTANSGDLFALKLGIY